MNDLPHALPRCPRALARPALVLLGLITLAASLHATEDPEKIVVLPKKALLGSVSTSSAANPREAGDQVREALGTGIAPHKKLTLTVAGKGSAPGPAAVADAVAQAPAVAGKPAPASASQQYARARAAALGDAVALARLSPDRWSYEGDTGPQHWARLHPDFGTCARGKRQSPVAIQSGNTLLGPAEPVLFSYEASEGTVINTGHTIQVDVRGSNSITLRGARYQLEQIHLHSPAEEQIDGKRAALGAHLVHRNDEGQLAVVAVQLEPGEANALIDKVWTYMPLDVKDRVRMPAGLINLGELLPVDQRYYQYMGSLTTPPCSEGVLWVVLKTPLTVSPAQLRLFTQLYPMNARPVQPLNDRPLREAQ